MKNKVIFGNWKMNGTNADIKAFLKTVDKKAKNDKVIAGLAVPFTALETAIKKAKNIKIAAENVHWAENGAYTGEVSIPMLQELGVEYVVIGHSERREMFGETDEAVNKKALALLKAGMVPILCCGETLETYENKKTNKFVSDQIKKGFKDISAEDAKKVIVAYEPIWAIGTGKTATPEIAQDVCATIRETLGKVYNKTIAKEIAIQYGGSVKPANIKDLMKQKDIDGALVGGASLIAEDYLELINYNK
ncbi:Triosephosphate isomerase [Mesoplasma sp. JKS002658]|uniref:triose-phosphate isomerase n=1 Tax=Mesoplasma whartonense TaxID=2878854 RepID=UPI002022ACE3|nr:MULTISPECIES: triose-phosphate isomerase [unclassified Mesoplasma]MCL8211576.1 Triosephosphate isomerase [Mesoplasma sp. JKS002664]MCL8212036.1 Triosephosphate isomerase [Mesoplasma sp. JKS002662]MCL8213859.1 Triosephosphate isomerase [Mesoplasma sp. JKS002658]MCL8214825.1 Triosephosphate isomerase [Mesoplasma sp. JKS002663]MCL8215178.1 Triosephosphate isomerase [Mesoplasma sp. JKS002659]